MSGCLVLALVVRALCWLMLVYFELWVWLGLFGCLLRLAICVLYLVCRLIYYFGDL